MWYVSIPEIEVYDRRDVRIVVAAHGEYWDRRRQVDRERDSYAAWSLAPFVVLVLAVDYYGTETIEQYIAEPLPATSAAIAE